MLSENSALKNFDTFFGSVSLTLCSMRLYVKRHFLERKIYHHRFPYPYYSDCLSNYTRCAG